MKPKAVPLQFLFVIAIVALAGGYVLVAARADDAAASPQGLALFTADVRPLLVQHCLKCHGGEKVKGEFDLVTRGGLLHPGAEGTNVMPGNSKGSRLMKLIRHETDPTMPAKADKLPEPAIAKIAAWIDAGAPYDKPLIDKAGNQRNRAEVSAADRNFWSFRPLAKVEPPEVKNAAWCRTPIDRFILAKLEAKNVVPNNPADKRKLIRRAYLDLIGLPPGPEAVEAFVNDPDPKAWENLIDTLLASPQYGERWARHWLDLARFAESHGYEHDYDRPTAYHYRDFVIRALNEDMPYDRFVRLQLAGDEVEPGNPEALKATGYLAAGTHATQITAATAEKERYDELDDMASTVGTSLLGLTVGCARCHDHKYDPIPTRDYYRLVSTFTSTVRTEVELDTDALRDQKEREEFDRKHKLLVDQLAAFEKERLPARMEKWLADGHPTREVKWHVLDIAEATATSGNKLVRQPDGSIVATGNRPNRDTYTIVANTYLNNIRAIKLEALADPALPHGGPGRADNGNFALSNVRVRAVPYSGRIKGRSASPNLTNPKATFEQSGFPVASTTDEDNISAWAIDPQVGRDHAALWELDEPIDYDADGAKVTITTVFYNNVGHSIGRMRLSIATDDGPYELAGEQGRDTPVEVVKILREEAADRTDADRAALLAFYRDVDPEARRLELAIEADAKRAPQPRKEKALIASEGVKPLRLHTAQPDIPDLYPKTYYLKRGDVNQKDGEAPAGPLLVLNRAPGADEHRWQAAPPAADSKLTYRRTALANWLTDVDAGAGNLLARVIVNRLWQHHLGRGIVATPNDFGAQGSKPTHPELLDYLANQLVASGWHLKSLHKQIMTSAVYLQSTAYDEARAAVDRDDDLLWRRQPHRLEGEAIRDSMLAVSGTLDPAMFGPGSLDEAMRRRSIYFFVKRSKLIPMMMLFDWPDSLQGLGQRAATTVAPQALALMNHPQVQAYAAAFAKSLMPAAARSLDDAVRQAYTTALSRPPDADELAEATTFLRQQTEAFKADGKPDALEMSLTGLSQTLFSLNEFIYVD